MMWTVFYKVNELNFAMKTNDKNREFVTSLRSFLSASKNI